MRYLIAGTHHASRLCPEFPNTTAQAAAQEAAESDAIRVADLPSDGLDVPMARAQQVDSPLAAVAMANNEATTPMYFALKLSPTTFGVFDVFHDEAGRQAHLNGPIAKALMAKAADLFACPPSIEAIDVLGLKNRAA